MADDKGLHRKRGIAPVQLEAVELTSRQHQAAVNYDCDHFVSHL